MEKESSLPPSLQKIAVLRALQLGDLLCSVPVFRALRKNFPDAEITLIGLPHQEQFQHRFRNYIDRFIPFPGYPGLPEQEASVSEIPHFLENVQHKNFDLVIQLQGSGIISNPLVTLFNGKITAGFYGKDAYHPNETYYTPYPEKGHETHRLLTLLTTLSISLSGEELEFPITDREQKESARILEHYHIVPYSYICIHPGSRSEDRRWDLSNFAQAADHAAELGYTIVFTGTEEEIELIKMVQQEMKHMSLSLAGKTSLGVTASLLKNARLLIANDTGISHLANALEVPSIIIFTGSEIERWAPIDQTLHKVINGTQKTAEEHLATLLTDTLTTPHRSFPGKEDFISLS